MGGDRCGRGPGRRPCTWANAHHVGVWLSLEMHAYVLGPTRSGKTVTVVIPAVLEAPASCWPRRRAATSSPRPAACGRGVWRIRRPGPVRRPWPCPYLRPGGFGRGGPADPAQHALDPVAGVRGPDHGDAPRADPGGRGRIGPGVEQQGVGRERGRLHPGASVCGGDQQPADLEMLRVVGQPPQGARGRGPDPRAYGRAGMLRWADTIRGLETMDTRQRSSEWFGVRNAFAILADPKVRSTMGFLAARPASDRSEAHGRGS